MRATLLSVVLVLAATAPATAGAKTPAPPTIELYTMGQGAGLVERFGHAALCVRYPEHPGEDRCYNYGTTNFGSPIPLAFGVIRGESVFWVSVSDPASMIRSYRGQDRSVWRQRIPLEPDQAREAAALLAHDAKPENRTYRYHHFYDNCSTRVRDIVDRATGGKLSEATDADAVGASYRDFARRGFAGEDPLLVGSDFLLGRRADIRPSEYEAMFLPRRLRNGAERVLGAEPELVYARTGRPFDQSPGAGGRPWLIVLGLVLAAPAAAATVTGRRPRLGIAASTIPLAAIAALLWGVAIASPLAELRYNEILLVLWPTDAALALWPPRRRQRYALVRLAGLAVVSVLLALGVLVQPLWAPLAAITPTFVALLLTSSPAPSRGHSQPPKTPETFNF